LRLTASARLPLYGKDPVAQTILGPVLVAMVREPRRRSWRRAPRTAQSKKRRNTPKVNPAGRCTCGRGEPIRLIVTTVENWRTVRPAPRARWAGHIDAGGKITWRRSRRDGIPCWRFATSASGSAAVRRVDGVSFDRHKRQILGMIGPRMAPARTRFSIV